MPWQLPNDMFNFNSCFIKILVKEPQFSVNFRKLYHLSALNNLYQFFLDALKSRDLIFHKQISFSSLRSRPLFFNIDAQSCYRDWSAKTTRQDVLPFFKSGKLHNDVKWVAFCSTPAVIIVSDVIRTRWVRNDLNIDFLWLSVKLLVPYLKTDLEFRDSIMKCLSLIMGNTALQNDQKDFPSSPTCNSEVSFNRFLLKVQPARDFLKFNLVSDILPATSEKSQVFQWVLIFFALWLR